MVDRIQSSERNNANSWNNFAAQAEQVCRAGDDVSLRRILTSSRFEHFHRARKFSFVKGIVKDFPCVDKAQLLLRGTLFNRQIGYRLRPDAVDCTGTSIAHWAAQREHPTPLFKTLKELGSPLSKNNKAGMSPLHYLFWKNGPMKESSLREAARFLVGTGCIIDLRDRTGESPFHVACLRKDPIPAFHVLQELGTDLNMKTKKKETALHLVAASCDPEVMPHAFKFLLENGADSTCKDDADKTVLYYVFERKEISQEIRNVITKMIRPSFEDSISHELDSVVLSPQTSSGFSEKMSIDFSDGPVTPESPVNHGLRQFQVPPNPTTPFSSRYSPYEPRNARIRQRSSTQDLYPITTSNYHQTFKPASCDTGTSTDDLLLNNQFQLPQCRLWDYGMELDGVEGLCSCARCEREMVSKTEAEISRIRISDVERENEELRRQLKKQQDRLERHENCPICMTAYTISSRRTLKSCGHMLCAECAQTWLETEQPHLIEQSLNESIPLKEPVLCPVCRTPYDTNDLVKSLIS